MGDRKGAVFLLLVHGYDNGGCRQWMNDNNLVFYRF